MTLSDPQLDILTSTCPVNLKLAGQGSGKSHLAGLISYDYVSRFPKCIGLIAANTHQQLTKSTLAAVRRVWKSLGVLEYNEKTKTGHYVIGTKPPASFDKLHEYDNYTGIVSFSWGAVVYLASLENYKAIDGIEIAWAILDETKDTRPEAVKEVILGRLRQRGIFIDAEGNKTSEPTDTPFNPVYFLTSPAKVPWIAEWFQLDDYADEIRRKIYSPPQYFRKSIGNKFVTISSTYLNQANLPSNYIDNQKQNLPSQLQNMLIYGDPFSKAGGEAYYGFDRGRHVVKGLRESIYKDDQVLHIGFDFNVKPYTSLLVYQIKDKKVYQIDEICTESNTAKACKVFLSKYGNHRNCLFVYGDPSGRSASTKTEEGQNDYTIIQRELKALKPILKVQTKAPAVAMRINWVNAILEGNSPVELLIDERCKNTINDFLYLKQAADGTKAKTKKTEDGVTFEEYGHCFIGETLVTTIAGQKRIDSIKPGDLVLTRSGFKSVEKVFDNGLRKVSTYSIGDKIVTCTNTHYFYCEERGFTAIKDLENGSYTFNTIQDGLICRSKRKVSRLEDLNSQDTQELTGDRVERVYDLSISDNHEYFANGILVHNCSDVCDYTLTSAFAQDWNQFSKGTTGTTVVNVPMNWNNHRI